ncbi:hypothetical protein [Neorhizobium sp. T25_13]|uniref:hypothetical protein n=1 Tax=Neorhizobium sp. T25_13 TaxID=2093830 RepID=UPI000CF8C0C0|nr:hypothetical protein [Neorhizobium sp. T25_13]
MNPRIIITTRRRLEAKIEEMIGLLDILDGDPDVENSGDEEPWLGGSPQCGEYDLEVDGDEQDYNGDEGDYSVGRLTGGCGL